ncbi:hypothetical protein ACFRAE_04385 [Sphingobacterium sp. HJSM2_6]|uniref:hypothetical protein n=1 Tax=Sphingobacterium sp. HJSM2_6 TaxID=3366264 RepID=UPI003BEDD9AF
MIWPANGKIAAIGGTLCTIGATYTWADIVSTIAMASAGTIVSFLISDGLSRIYKRRKL